MGLTLGISITTIILMILSIIFIPDIKIKRFSIGSHWIVTLLGAILLIVFNRVSLDEIKNIFISSASINPIKILILFFSMSFLSIVLDDLGFFKYLAIKATNISKSNQRSLFTILFISISLLTVFTSNDIIILTFTPFIIYLAKRLNVNPIPYLVMEFIAANTLSMSLLIGNPTNIYLGLSSNIDFIKYMIVMLPLSLIVSIVTFFILLLVFNKELKKPIVKSKEEIHLDNKYLVIIEASILVLCIILMALSNIFNFEMYLISLIFAVISFVVLLVYHQFNKNVKALHPIFRLPFELIPFLISMFIIVIALNNVGVPKMISELIFTDSISDSYTFGLTSLVSSNLINNIPMSILFSYIVIPNNYITIYSTIIASNLGAIITPLGSLAGIMWLKILKKNEVEFSFLRFMKYGFIGIIEAIISFTLLLIFI